MTTLSDFAPDRCAKIAEFFLPSYEVFPPPYSSKIVNLYEDNKSVTEFHPRSTKAYFLLKQTIEDHPRVDVLLVKFIKLTSSHQVIITYNLSVINPSGDWIEKEAETDILALFLAAEELMRRVQDNG